MCGIAGYLGRLALSPESLESTLRLMRRRGPDAQAWRQVSHEDERRVYLLHSRLTIIDLSERSNQPFTFGDWTLSYNGELYNYIELREDLRTRGYTFETTSDTEVLIKLLDAYGAEALDRAEGMWAFAAWNDRTRTLWLSRDRFGEKPLYLHRTRDGVYFGSEPKFIFAMLGHRLPVNETHVRRYLTNGYKALFKTSDSFHEGIEPLPSASLAAFAPDGESILRYWNPTFEHDEELSFDDAVSGVRDRLERSIDLRLRADVPLAFCLSGGVDSNAIVAIASRRLGRDVHGFTLHNEDARYDESDLVRTAVTGLGIRHTWVPVRGQDFLSNLRALVTQHDGPIHTISYYIQWLLMREVADAGYRISIMGTGADELLSGYYDHHNLYLAAVKGTEGYAAAVGNWNAHVRPLVRNPYLQQPDLYERTPAERRHIFDGSDEFSGYLASAWSEPFEERAFTPTLMRNRMLNELFEEVVPVLLHEDDLNAMYYSIENRSPFLDRELAEFCFRIPTRHLIRDGYAKAILRHAADDVVRPEVLWNRRKVGFNAPIEALIDFDDAMTREWLLDDGPLFEVIKRQPLEAMIGRPSFSNTESKFLFNAINTKVFLEQEQGEYAFHGV